MARTKSNATTPATATIGKTVDDAMVAIERDNPRLKGVLPKDYARPGLDKHRLGELIDLIGTISLLGAPSIARQEEAPEPSDARRSTHRSVDILVRVYEYFLTMFASAEGKNGSPAKCEARSANVEVKTALPFVIQNSSFDIPAGPACGSGGMFVQSEKFVESHGGVAKCEVRSANVEVKTPRPFVIRHFPWPRARRDLPPRPRNVECRSANVELKSHE